MELNVIMPFLLLLAIFIYALVVGKYLIGWLNTPLYLPKHSNHKTNTSIVVPMRNEEENIIECLEGLLVQEYPHDCIQVIVVDDNSTDNSSLLVTNFIMNHPDRDIELLRLKKENSLEGKKNALKMAIRKAKGELLLTVDADCTIGREWLSTIVSFYQEGDFQMVVSPVNYFPVNNLFEKMQALEFSGLMGITGGAIKKNEALMCNGANLAFTKSAFEQVGGYDDNLNIKSGDDMFLMIKINKQFPNRIGFLKSRKAEVTTKPIANASGFINQRLRWSSKTFNYSDKRIKFVSIVTYLANVSFLISLFIIVFSDTFVVWSMATVIIKLLIDFTFLFFVTSFFGRRKLLWLFPMEEILYAFYVILIGAYSQIGGYSWKERLKSSLTS